MSQDSRLTHLDEQGRVRMVDVGGKPPLRRQACAEGFFCGSATTLDRLEAGELPKGEALARPGSSAFRPPRGATS